MISEKEKLEQIKIEQAKNLYTRICSLIKDSNGNFSDEWKNIQNNILLDKDTLFLVNNSDFEIIVRKNIQKQSINMQEPIVPVQPVQIEKQPKKNFSDW
jgi:hypothetical protein